MNELRALQRTFSLTPRNNDTEKYVLWVIVAVWAIGGLGLLYGVVPLHREEAKELWTFLSGVTVYLFGRVQGKEKERIIIAEDDE
jgi:hypothetical protein